MKMVQDLQRLEWLFWVYFFLKEKLLFEEYSESIWRIHRGSQRIIEKRLNVFGLLYLVQSQSNTVQKEPGKYKALLYCIK